MKLRKGVLWCMACLVPMVCGSALAATTLGGSTSSPTVATLSRLHAQAAVLKERLAVARLQAEIRKENTGGAPVASMAQGPSLQGFLSGQSMTPPPPSVAVQSITGMVPRLQAVVALASGATLTVHVGDEMPDGLGRVARITSRVVVVRQNGRLSVLPWESGAAAIPSPSSPLGVGPVPPVAYPMVAHGAPMATPAPLH